MLDVKFNGSLEMVITRRKEGRRKSSIYVYCASENRCRQSRDYKMQECDSRKAACAFLAFLTLANLGAFFLSIIDESTPARPAAANFSLAVPSQ